MKVIANHMVDPRIVMQPNVGSDRSWVWTAYDYAEGDLHEEVFALKFGKPQDAEEFKAAFDEAKKAMKSFVAGTGHGGGRDGRGFVCRVRAGWMMTCFSHARPSHSTLHDDAHTVDEEPEKEGDAAAAEDAADALAGLKVKDKEAGSPSKAAPAKKE